MTMSEDETGTMLDRGKDYFEESKEDVSQWLGTDKAKTTLLVGMIVMVISGLTFVVSSFF